MMLYLCPQESSTTIAKVSVEAEKWSFTLLKKSQRGDTYEIENEKYRKTFLLKPTSRPHWGKNPHFIQKSHFEKIAFATIHIFKTSHLTKFTFSKSQFCQNSHFPNLIFDKIHIFQTSNSREFLDKMLVFAAVCRPETYRRLKTPLHPKFQESILNTQYY